MALDSQPPEDTAKQLRVSAPCAPDRRCPVSRCGAAYRARRQKRQQGRHWWLDEPLPGGGSCVTEYSRDELPDGSRKRRNMDITCADSRTTLVGLRPMGRIAGKRALKGEADICRDSANTTLPGRCFLYGLARSYGRLWSTPSSRLPPKRMPMTAISAERIARSASTRRALRR
jgi:hypothetical protein